MEELIMLEECPVCRGNGFIMHEGGWSVQVECADCSAHTIYMEYNNETEKMSGSWATVQELQEVLPYLETWSQIVVEKVILAGVV